MKKLYFFNLQSIKFLWIVLLLTGSSGAAFGATFTVTKIADTNDNAATVKPMLQSSVMEIGI